MGIKQIAKLANVSIGTIDRVLHKRGGVSKETEKKILKIIKETGYQKNMMASRLKLAAVKKIKFAVLFPETKNKYDYWKLPKKGISKAVDELKELGVKVDYYQFAGSSSSFKEASQQIFLKNYDAIITVPFFEKECNTLLKIAKSKNIQVVFLDTEIELNNQAHFINQNSHIAGMVAGRLLHGLVGNEGKYFIVNIINDRGIQVNNKQREDGFRAFFESIGQEVDINTINHPLNDTFKVTIEMESWFKGDDPKGIFVTNSRAHLIPEILEANDVSNSFLMGFDLNKKNLEYLRNDQIHFLINQQPKYQGYIAIKSLFNFLTKQDDSELHLDIPVEIIVKEHLASL
ncbi:substrate-binding domain-containing protein [Maribacter algarum]|uniref:Substrate-binding domain-containing protein n=1 Tax=Maribacter algarum (ex Zhang et al. 2020) TaxID=2578118 RepID=A0A5S3PTV7_9FLAO|nr:substrate-binding domain-containing protein [Maribacter algarum]TMM58415.1 substrate-binding domain-containing protein [Maribacter algarum]